MLETPVALIIFNRPQTTAQVFAAIARAKPRTLFVIADGPRPGHPDDAERCAAARAIADRVDWKCEVVRDYSDANFGCGRRPATGISRVFEQVETAIILEDDCVPHPTFFRYCEQLLERYREDERIMHIGADGFQLGRTQRPFSYFFSRHYPGWGWASWRRAWRHFDADLTLWPALRAGSWLRDIVGDDRLVAHWRRVFDATHGRGETVTWWDYQWTFACWAQNGLAILPNVTLVSNIGFGRDATHTTSASDRVASLPTAAMEFPMRHPPYVVRDPEADAILAENVIVPHLQRRASLYQRLRRTCADALPSPIRRSISTARSKILPRLIGG